MIEGTERQAINMVMYYSALLSENQSFRADYPAEITYVSGCKGYEVLEKEYGIHETAGNGSTFLQAVNDGDNHVVAEVFITEWNKWIMLDPTYGSYCQDSSGEVLNLYEIRKRIINAEEYSFSDKLNYNGECVSDLEDLKEYYAKNLFFLRSKAIQGYGMHRKYGDMLEIAPIHFGVHERMIQNLQYRIHEYGDCKLFADWIAYEGKLENKYVDIETFYSSPCDKNN